MPPAGERKADDDLDQRTTETDAKIADGGAPRAIRMPISCVRWLTT